MSRTQAGHGDVTEGGHEQTRGTVHGGHRVLGTEGSGIQWGESAWADGSPGEGVNKPNAPELHFITVKMVRFTFQAAPGSLGAAGGGQASAPAVSPLLLKPLLPTSRPFIIIHFFKTLYFRAPSRAPNCTLMAPPNGISVGLWHQAPGSAVRALRCGPG